jgi:hypothetical protein
MGGELMDSEFDYRYEIGCQQCGYLESRRTFKDGEAAAQSLAERHNTPPCRVTLFDRMAHKGKPRLWYFMSVVR